MISRTFVTLLLFGLITFLHADGPADNQATQVRPIPPVGVPLSKAVRQELEKSIDQLEDRLNQLRNNLSPSLRRELPSIEILHKAVSVALSYNEFYQPRREVPAAHQLIEIAHQRITALEQGNAPWNEQTGLVVRGYRSKIDDSVQPYGLVIPADLNLNSHLPVRLDTWFHGRGEKLTELSFLNQRLTSPGQFTPANTIVLHLYGRYCNANKFAGEVDLFEALEDVKKHYRIDENRIVVRGFSMGGAACWQFATHFAGQWAAAAPGAGFSETAEFLRVFQKETLNPTWYERKLWNWYDATAYALNLFNCPTVAYSGEIDRQKQAANIMAKYLRNEGMSLTHIIGPDTAHKYHPEAKEEINRLIDQIAAKGRDPLPRKVKFVTYTLRYHKMRWIELQGLQEHWSRAQIEAEINAPHSVSIQTTNINRFSINMPAGLCPLDLTTEPQITIDGTLLTAPKVQSDRSWNPHFVRTTKGWQNAGPDSPSKLQKRPGLQGPIDDAFMDSFLMVLPTGRPMNSVVQAWTTKEQQHAITHWRSQYRGVPRVKLDTQVTSQDIENHTLVLWGDPDSNSLMKRLSGQLPIQWNHEGVETLDRTYPSDQYVPVLIYPNPLNPTRYVVINSGFTFREYDHLNNARQIAKLPDWAIIDLSQPTTPRHPGRIADAGFFNESWELTKSPR